MAIEQAKGSESLGCALTRHPSVQAIIANSEGIGCSMGIDIARSLIARSIEGGVVNASSGTPALPKSTDLAPDDGATFAAGYLTACTPGMQQQAPARDERG